MLRRSARQSGYTIAELAIALFLSSAIAATAVPAASKILQQHRLAGVSRRLGFEIARARMQAVGQNCFMRIAVFGNNLYRRESSTDGVTYQSAGEVTMLPTGFTMQAGGTGTPRFDRQGLAPAATAITVSGPQGSQTISTTILGRVTTS